jgi:uncharacterized protein with PQ loop repeat
MNSILLACILTVIAFVVSSFKNKFKDMPALSLFFMITFDLMVIFGFYKLGIPNMEIAVGIALSTPLKLFIFIINQDEIE